MPTSQMVFNCKMYVSRVFIGLAIMLYEQLPVHHALLFNYCKGMQKSLEHFYFKFTLIFYTLGVLL